MCAAVTSWRPAVLRVPWGKDGVKTHRNVKVLEAKFYRFEFVVITG